MRTRFILLLSLLLAGTASAQDAVRTDTVGVRVYFRQGYSTLEPALQNNDVRLDEFVGRLARLRRDTLCRVRTIRIDGGTSPEGSSVMNRRLSEKRAAQIADYISDAAGLPHESFEIIPLGIDWQRLAELVEASDMPYRDEVLDILRDTPEWVMRDGVVVDSRKRRLGMLRGGRAWWYMSEHFFPELRTSAVRVVCEIEHTAAPAPAPVPDQTAAPDVAAEPEPAAGQPHTEPEPATADCKPFFMSLRTNMLYDVLAVPNLGVEFHLGRGWAIGAGWMYGWWDSDRRHDYWRVYGGDLALRRYFGRRAAEKPLTGHHLGIYGQTLTYDFETGGRGYMGGQPGGSILDRASWGAGIEYGYALPIGRRLNLDFGIGVGYLGGKYYEYLPIDGHYVWQATKQRRWFGPTKAEISLVWLIGCGNYNNTKGGKR